MATYTWDQIATYLTTTYWTSEGEAPHKFNLDASRTITVNISSLSANAQQMAIQALQQWSMATGINFVQTTSPSAQIRFQSTDQSGAYSYSTGIVNGFIGQSVVNIPDNWWPYTTGGGMSTNGYMFMTYIHEIGHALGLGHAGPYNGSANFTLNPALQGTNGYNLYDNDSWSATIMSYFDQTDNTFIPGSFAYVATIMPADIIAIQNLYGAGPTGYQSGNTVWGPGGNIGGYLQNMLNMRAGLVTANAAFFDNKPISFTIYDTGGIDTIDMSAFTMNQEILLTELEYSNLFGLIDNVVIARGSVIENAIGGSGADTITGNNVANVLEGRGGVDTINGGLGDDTLIGGAGGDILDGGGGNDTASYAGSSVGVTVDLNLVGTAQTSSGDASGDRLTNIENLTGSSQNDTLTGNSGANVLNGGLGDDTLIGGAGADQLIGGGGTDTASYASSGAAVQVNLTLSGAQTSTGDASGDTLTNIANLIGSSFGDTLTGTSGVNTITGGGGDDTINGNGGNDIINAGDGDDTIVYNTGLLAANVQGGIGTDTLLINGGPVPTSFNLVTAGIERAYHLNVSSTYTQIDTYNSSWLRTFSVVNYNDGAHTDYFYVIDNNQSKLSQVLSYNVANELTFQSIYDANGHIDRSYNATTGQLVQQLNYDIQDRLTLQSIYDASGHIDRSYNAVTGQLQQQLNYDSQGRLVLQSIYDSNGHIDRSYNAVTGQLQQQLNYDSQGRLVLQSIYDSNGHIDRSYNPATGELVQQLSYDTQGNLILQSIYDSNGHMDRHYGLIAGEWELIQQLNYDDHSPEHLLSQSLYDANGHVDVIYDPHDSFWWTTHTISYDTTGTVISDLYV
jgi:Ca2+-binding RTX toxin-like protein